MTPSSPNVVAFSGVFLENLPLFRDLNPHQLEAVQNIMQRRQYPPGAIILNEHQPADMVFVIVQGSVKVCVHQNQQRVILGLRGRGELLGELAVLDGGGRSATVISQTPCELGCITRSDFWDVLWKIPIVPYNVSCLLADRVRRLSSHIQTLSTLSVRGRLARQIVSLANEHSQLRPNGHYEILVRLTQDELAQMVGTTRVQINHTLAPWKKSGWVQNQRGRMIVTALDKLQQIADEENVESRPA